MSIAYEKLYPWLEITHSVEDYLDPVYYARLLKPYVFEGLTDLQHLQNFIGGRNPDNAACLELGCGSGRATSAALNALRAKSLDLVDLSDRMLEHSKKLFCKDERIRFIKCDILEFMMKSRTRYDCVFSLWSFSHSVHQHFEKSSVGKGRILLAEVFEKFVRQNLFSGSSFFLIHFDSLSEEQRILIKQWKRINPVFREDDKQSPSKRAIDATLRRLAKKRLVDFRCEHHRGEEIHYSSMDELLEVFMNFHLESAFNQLGCRGQVIDDISKYCRRFARKDGSLRIRPGCYVYAIDVL